MGYSGDFESDDKQENQGYSGQEFLHNIESGMKSYNADITNKIAETLNLLGVQPLQSLNVLDFGAGIGSLAQNLLDLVGVKTICVEIDSLQSDLLRDKGFDVYRRISDVPTKVDFIYTSNVLEHILDDTTILHELYEALERQGYLLIYVPAHQFLFSELDREVGHFRRYSKKDLHAKVEAAGFQICNIEYHDSLGFLASLAFRLFGFNKKLGMGTSISYRLFDKLIFPMSRLLDTIGFRKIIGKNLLVVARK